MDSELRSAFENLAALTPKGQHAAGNITLPQLLEWSEIRQRLEQTELTKRLARAAHVGELVQRLAARRTREARAREHGAQRRRGRARTRAAVVALAGSVSMSMRWRWQAICIEPHRGSRSGSRSGSVRPKVGIGQGPRGYFGFAEG